MTRTIVKASLWSRSACPVVSAELAVDFASTIIPRSQILDTPFISGVQRQLSRYFNEFEELQLLGKGAFGAVIKV